MAVFSQARYQSAEDIISMREVEVLQLTSIGLSSQEIANRLHISRETVKSHRRNLLIKLEAKNAAHLVRKAIESRIISITSIDQLDNKRSHNSNEHAKTALLNSFLT